MKPANTAMKGENKRHVCKHSASTVIVFCLAMSGLAYVCVTACMSIFMYTYLVSSVPVSSFVTVCSSCFFLFTLLLLSICVHMFPFGLCVLMTFRMCISFYLCVNVLYVFSSCCCCCLCMHMMYTRHNLTCCCWRYFNQSCLSSFLFFALVSKMMCT